MCRVRRLLRTLCLELSRLCHKYHHQRIRDHQNGTDAGLGFWVIGLPDFFCIFVRFCCEQAYKSNRFRTYPALRVLPGGNQVDGLPPAFSEEQVEPRRSLISLSLPTSQLNLNFLAIPRAVAKFSFPCIFPRSRKILISYFSASPHNRNCLVPPRAGTKS